MSVVCVCKCGVCVCVCVPMCMYVCVCVYQRERECISEGRVFFSAGLLFETIYLTVTLRLL